MCTGVEIGLAIAAIAVSVASITTTQVMADQQAKARKKLAKQNADLKRDQISAQHAQAAELSAQKMFELARSAQLAKGKAASKNLADRSVAAIGRSIGFELGQDKATLQKNQANIALEVGARLQGIELDLASQNLQIGDTSGLKLGLEIGLGVSKGVVKGIGVLEGIGTFDAAELSKTAIPTPQISAGFTSEALTGG